MERVILEDPAEIAAIYQDARAVQDSMSRYPKDNVESWEGNLVAAAEFYLQDELVLMVSVTNHGVFGIADGFDRLLRVFPRDGPNSVWLGTKEQAAPLLQWLPEWYERVPN